VTTAFGSSSSLNANLTTSHSVMLNGLSGSTLYHFSVRSRDAAGNLSVSGDFTFTTASTPILVSITAPSAGAIVTGMVAVSATASDSAGVPGVQFQLDGANLGARIIAAPYTLAWNTQGSTYLIFGEVMADSGPIATISAGSGFTERQSLNSEDTVSEDRVQTSPGAVAAAFTFAATASYLAQV